MHEEDTELVVVFDDDRNATSVPTCITIGWASDVNASAYFRLFFG
jgi:hypothetical protein